MSAPAVVIADGGQVNLRGALWLRGRQPSERCQDVSNPYFDYGPSKCIVIRPLRSGLRRDPGHSLTISGHYFDSGSKRPAVKFPRFRMRVVRCVRAGLPDSHPDGGDRPANAAVSPPAPIVA